MSKKRKKRRRRRGGGGGGGGGALMGMRKGFKNVAGSVTGQKPAKKKSSVLSWVLTLAILAAAVGFFLSNR